MVTCLISKYVIKDPTFCHDGLVYNQIHIHNWFDKEYQYLIPLFPDNFRPDPIAKKIIQAVKECDSQTETCHNLAERNDLFIDFE